MSALDLRERLLSDVRRHPRVVHQGLFETDVDRTRIADALPGFVPFRSQGYAHCLWVLDWDHRLPSKTLILRLYAYYSDRSYELGQRSFEERTQQVAREDLFPEFDVSDYAGLHADEAYEGEVELGKDPPAKYRLVSEWRRQVDPEIGRKAEAVVRGSDEFKALSSQIKTRPLGLGELEAAEWASPSESGHARWAVEVWYLKSFNGMVGEGVAFLVDPQDERVVSQRDFQFRAG